MFITIFKVQDKCGVCQIVFIQGRIDANSYEILQELINNK